jgi:hypothetical protein
VWKHIRRREECLFLFLRFVKYEVGDGSKIRLWHNLWCGDQRMKEVFPELFSIARCEEAWLANNMQFSNGIIQWNVSFLRSIQDWEVDLAIVCFGKSYSLKWRQDGEDHI